MIRSELREQTLGNEIAKVIAESYEEQCRETGSFACDIIVRKILSIPHLKEALDFYEACQSAFEVNGEFKVTKENVKGVGGVSAS